MVNEVYKEGGSQDEDQSSEDEDRVGKQNQYFGLSQEKLMEEREKICHPNAYSENWLEIFDQLDNDQETIDILKQDFQLNFL